jgi:hypothetical protein
MLRVFISENVYNSSNYIIYNINFWIVHVTKPAFLYKTDGSLREFGVGYRNKTILPIWLLSIIMGILSYLFVLYYLAYPKIV